MSNPDKLLVGVAVLFLLWGGALLTFKVVDDELVDPHREFRHAVQLADQAHHYEIESLLCRQAHEKEVRMFEAQVRMNSLVTAINGIDFLLRALLDYLDGGEVLQRLQKR